MLQGIRDRTQGWIAGIIISILIVSFGLWGIHSYLISNTNTNFVAKVNGVEISKAQAHVTYERLRRQLQLQSNNVMTPYAETTLQEKSLQSLIEMQVLTQSAFSEGYRITGQQVDGFLQSLPELQVNGAFSLARFQQVLDASLFNASDFLELIHTTMLIDQPRLGIEFSSFALPNEIQESVALIGQERKIQYAIIPSQLIPGEQKISEAAIQTYYNKHQEQYKTPEQVSIDYLVLSVNELMKGINVKPEEIKAYYDDNSNSFVLPEQWALDEVIISTPKTMSADEKSKAKSKMEDLAKQAKDGKDFKLLMKENPELKKGDASLAALHNAAQLPPPLRESVKSLTKAGNSSDAIVLPESIAIVKVTAHKDTQVQPFDAVKDKAKLNLIQHKAQEKYAELREKFANTSYEHPDSLAVPSKELNLPIQSTLAFIRSKGIDKDISSNPKVREAAFSNDVMNLQNNSDVIQVTPDLAVVLRVKTHTLAQLVPLAKVKKDIEAKLQKDLVDSLVFELATNIKMKLGSKVLSDEQAAAQYHLTWINPGFIGRHVPNLHSAIIYTAFSMPIPSDGKSSYAVSKTAGGYAIVELFATKPGQLQDPNKEEYRVFADQIQTANGMLEYELDKQALIAKAKIVKADDEG